MRIEHFRYLINNEYDVFYFSPTLVLYKKPWCLVDYKTSKDVKFKSLDEVLVYEFNNKTVEELIQGLDKPYIPPLDGGRGASSGAESTFKFDHARGGGGKDESRKLLPAVANTKIKSKTFEGALAEFKRNHLLSNKEFAYEVDSNGYVHQYVAGNATSVPIASLAKVRRGEKTMIIHNHPGGGAFSDSDLLSTAAHSRESGIIASGKNYDYTFEKGQRFNAQAFSRAVKSAKMSGKSYDDAVHKWLKRNQKKYGYKYSRTKN